MIKLPGKLFRKESIHLGPGLSIPIDIRVTKEGVFYCVPRDPLSNVDGPKFDAGTAEKCKMAASEWLTKRLREGLQWELSLVFDPRLEVKSMIGGRDRLVVESFYVPMWLAKIESAWVYVHAVSAGIRPIDVIRQEVDMFGPEHGFYRRTKDTPRPLPAFMKHLPYTPELALSFQKLEDSMARISNAIVAVNSRMHLEGVSSQQIVDIINKEFPDAPSK